MERLFGVIQFVTITVFFLIGILLYRMGTPDMLLESRSAEREIMRATFVMEEQKPKAKEEPKPKPPVEQRKVEDIPVDLTKPQPEETPQPPVRQEQRQVRQVYGLKKVYSQGLGAGGSSDDAVIGKLGNTTDKDFDTLTATSDDLKPNTQPVESPQPKAASAASITKKPRLKSAFRRLKPQYSQEMLQSKVEGTVKARILIGADGNVRRVEIIEDIGFDSAEIAREFLMTLQFEPAQRGDDAVSVWIPFSIKFELI
jgi:outer membrane biosynthesis protein TonB